MSSTAASGWTYSSAEPPPVVVGFAGPRDQRRLTVAFRWILLIPHFVVLAAFGVVAWLGTIFGWFAALVMGRLPRGLDGFLARVVQYWTRVNAYSYLLTDRYPPFDLAAQDYPVAVTVESDTLNRLAVFFRGILAIPAYALSALVATGMSVAAVFVWLIVLISGRMPASLHQAISATLRYQARFGSYMCLITPSYPWGLFGDRAASEPAAAPPEWGLGGWQPATATSPDLPMAEPAPAAEPAPLAEPADPGAGWAPPSAAPAEETTGFAGLMPLATSLLLSKAAKRIVAVFLALGVIWAVAYGVIVGLAAGSNVSGIAASNEISADYQSLSDSVSRFDAASTTCSQQGGGLSCEQNAVRQLAPAFALFSSQVASVSVPSSAESARQTVVEDSDQLKSTLERMAAAPSAQSYLSEAEGFQGLGSRFDSDYRSLQQALIG